MKPTKGVKLTPRQERFCQEYAKSLHQTNAAIKAGYSKESASEQASRLVRNPQVIKRLNQIIGQRTRRYEVSAERILKELARVAYSDITNYVTFNESGVRIKESSDLSPAQAAAIQEVSEVINQNGGTTKFKLHDKVKALELLGKHLKLFSDRVEHSIDSKLEDLIGGSMVAGGSSSPEAGAPQADKESEESE